MKKRLLVFGAVGALVVMGAVGVAAQGGNIIPVPYEPSICSSSRYDLNGDGAVNKRDVLWFDQHSVGCLDPYGQAIPGVECDPKLDVDRDGKIDRYDLDYLYRFILTCMFPPTSRTGPQPGNPTIPRPVEP